MLFSSETYTMQTKVVSIKFQDILRLLTLAYSDATVLAVFQRDMESVDENSEYISPCDFVMSFDLDFFSR